MWMNVLRTMEDAVNLPLVPTNLTASPVPVILDTPVMDSPAQVRSLAAILQSKIHLYQRITELLIK